jgi:hypothetical protein
MVGVVDRKLACIRHEQHTFPDVFDESIEFDHIGETKSFLSTCGPTSSLTLVLRMSHQKFQEIRNTPDHSPRRWLMDEIHNSFYVCPLHPNIDHRPSFDIVRDEWNRIVGTDSPWRGVLHFPTLHTCEVRGPTTALLALLSSSQIVRQDGPIAGIIQPVPVGPPERAMDWGILRDAYPEMLLRVEGLQHHFDALKHLEGDSLAAAARNILDDTEMVAALDFFQRVINWIPWIKSRFIPDSVDAVLRKISAAGGYLNGLNLRDLSAFGDLAGKGQKIILLDSGADESSPFLQQQVCNYTRFDAGAQKKRAHDCLDFACHGTKMASLIVGKRISLSSIGLTDEFVRQTAGKTLSDYNLAADHCVQIGIAPGAKIAVGGILGGEPFAESGGIQQMVAGLEWAASLASEGYGIVNLSIEADGRVFKQETRHMVDALFGIIKFFKSAAIIAAGNHGLRSAALTDKAFAVGGLCADGTGLPGNGPRFDFLAPGENLLCGQPRLDRLGGLLINQYTGSSVATAVVSGCVAALCGRFRDLRPLEAAEALKQSADEGRISLDAAVQLIVNTGHEVDNT